MCEAKILFLEGSPNLCSKEVFQEMDLHPSLLRNELDTDRREFSQAGNPQFLALVLFVPAPIYLFLQAKPENQAKPAETKVEVGIR